VSRRAVVFDVDNTLTPPRKPLEREMAHLLTTIDARVAVAAGSDLPLVRRQLIEPLGAFGYPTSLDVFVCNGAAHYRCRFGGEPAIELVSDFDLPSHLGPGVYDRVVATTLEILDAPEFRLAPPVRVIGERLVHRRSMLNVAPAGRPVGDLDDEAFRNREAFVAFDRATGFRARMLARMRERLGALAPDKGLWITLGGETSFDVVARGHDKTFPIRTLLAEGCAPVSYVGDALFEGGNDFAVVEMIRSWPDGECPVSAVQVDDWRATPRVLRELGLIG
jgi:phosphomannomutase